MTNWKVLLKAGRRQKINISHVRVAYARVIEKYDPIVFTMRSFTEKLVEEYKSIVPGMRREFTPLTFANFSTTTIGFTSAGIGKAFVYLGASLVLQGVSELLFPLPKPPSFESEEDPRLSFSFGGTQQTGRAGTPVPLVYGEIFTGSVVISGGIDTEQVQA